MLTAAEELEHRLTACGEDGREAAAAFFLAAADKMNDMLNGYDRPDTDDQWGAGIANGDHDELRPLQINAGEADPATVKH